MNTSRIQSVAAKINDLIVREAEMIAKEAAKNKPGWCAEDFTERAIELIKQEINKGRIIDIRV